MISIDSKQKLKGVIYFKIWQIWLCNWFLLSTVNYEWALGEILSFKRIIIKIGFYIYQSISTKFGFVAIASAIHDLTIVSQIFEISKSFLN